MHLEKAWHESDYKYKSVDKMSDSFMEVYTKYKIETVPQKE